MANLISLPTTPAALERLGEQASDYARMADALKWLSDRWLDRPSLDEAAAAVGLSPHHFQRIFTRWAGVSPKTFMAAIAHAEARGRLEAGETVLDAAYDVGLSGPSRLHDLFVAQEAVTPGEARKRGEGVEIAFGYAPTPFGLGLFTTTARGLCGRRLPVAGRGGSGLSGICTIAGQRRPGGETTRAPTPWLHGCSARL